MRIERYIPVFVFLLAAFFWGLERYFAHQYQFYAWLLWTAYFLQWICVIAEIYLLGLQNRTDRIWAYVILSIGNSYLPLSGSWMAGVPLVWAVGLTWAILSLASFVPVFIFSMRSDRDLPLSVRLTPFGFSLLGSYTHFLAAMSV
jgi:hypothetical protein